MEGEDGERDPQGCVGGDASRPETVTSCSPTRRVPVAHLGTVGTWLQSQFSVARRRLSEWHRSTGNGPVREHLMAERRCHLQTPPGTKALI